MMPVPRLSHLLGFRQSSSWSGIPVPQNLSLAHSIICLPPVQWMSAVENYWSCFSYPFSDVVPVCRAKLDLCLLVDSSGSIRDNNPPGGSPDNWQLQLEFLADLVEAFPIGQDETRITALVFSEQVELVFPLNRFNSLRELQESILDIPYMGQTTNTPEALHQAGIQCFNVGVREDADNVVVIITDGVPFPAERRTPALVEARKLKEKGIRIAAIGVTNVVDEEFLSGISSGSTYSMVERFQELGGQNGQISRQICEMVESGKHCKNYLHETNNLINPLRFSMFPTKHLYQYSNFDILNLYMLLIF